MDNEEQNVDSLQSILVSTKKIIGLPDEYEAFDADIITHINSVFVIINQLGVGPEDPFFITGKTETWDDFSTDPYLRFIRTYVPAKVRDAFDPPSGAAGDANQRVIAELEWRLRVAAETFSTGEADSDKPLTKKDIDSLF